VLGLKLREGSREEFFGRASLGATGVYATLEGPLGASRKTSWLVSARKSYLDYVLDRLDSSGFVLGYYDVTARLAHHPSPSQTVALGLLHGRSQWRNTEDDRGPASDGTADAGTDLITLQHRYLPGTRTWLETVAFVSRETGLNRFVDGTPSLDARSWQWGLRTDAARVLGRHRVEAGLLLRQLSEDAVARDRDRAGYRVTAQYDADALQGGGYVQDTWTTAGNRLSLTAGLRLDAFAETDETRVLPRAALTWEVTRGTRLFAGFGSYAQFPRFEDLYGGHGNPELRSESAVHWSLGLERSLGASTRVRIEGYGQELRDEPFAAASDWRIEGGRVRPAQPEAPLQNVLDGSSRGFDILLQRRSANGLSGWIAYSFGQARRHEDPGTLAFDSDFDQRHTLTVFGSYRITPSLNLSTKYRYGSGTPVPGFYEARGDAVYLSAERNLYRPEVYSRWDIRANKAFVFDGWKLTLYGEVINVLDRTHHRYNDLNGIDRTGQVFLETDTLFPILPSIGVTVDF
jgi:outer membrane cobalamin receptor